MSLSILYLNVSEMIDVNLILYRLLIIEDCTMFDYTKRILKIYQDQNICTMFYHIKITLKIY